MSEACARNDLVERNVSWVLWRMPLLAFVIGAFLAPPMQSVLWVPAFVVAGISCVVNARRCGRFHCFLTGPSTCSRPSPPSRALRQAGLPQRRGRDHRGLHRGTWVRQVPQRHLGPSPRDHPIANVVPLKKHPLPTYTGNLSATLRSDSAARDPNACRPPGAGANTSTLRLTHYGRRSGMPDEVTIWFMVEGEAVYLATANRSCRDRS